MLGRKFEDLLTLTPGVSIVQGPDGDEININGQRGIFDNISLDGGDYNDGFFGERSGGQRAAVDITLEAVLEFQVVASGTRFLDQRRCPGSSRPGSPRNRGGLFSQRRYSYRSGSTDTCPNIFAAGPFANLGAITDTASNAKSLYRGLTVGVRKRMSHHFMFEAEYTYSIDRDSDSNERNPFTFRYANIYNLAAEYWYSDRDERHKFNAYAIADLPFGFKGNLRMQSHSASPETDNSNGNGTGAHCSIDNSATRFVDGVD